MHKTLRFLIFTSLLIGVACSRLETIPTPTNEPTAVATIAVLSTVPPATASPTNTPPPTATSNIPPTPAPPLPTLPPLAQAPISPDQQTTLEQLNQASPPQRDDIRLAIAYRGLTEEPSLSAPPAETLPLNTSQTFIISNVDDNTISQIEAILLGISDHAYFWFDTGPGTFTPNSAELQEAGEGFDEIYEANVFYFGSENNPGIDGDSRVHIVHASPLALCDVTLSTVNSCGLAGYFTAGNVLPQSVDPNSNAREMFVMNINQFGTGFYLNVLGHEFRHMIEDNYDRGDTDWEVEGSAVLAEELLQYANNAQYRGNLFLQNPDQQLNSWTDGNTLPYYGQGYLFNRYLFDRLGVDLYRQFAQHPEPGLLSLDALAQANNLNVTGQTLWLDWLAALAVHNDPNTPDIYRFQGAVLNTAANTPIRQLPYQIETTVSQYAADYYHLPNDKTVTLTFQGSTHVPLLNTIPYSGQYVWYAQRGNYSNPRLTRTIDLTSVPTATLQYAVYVDIERGYDFAYVSVSADNGRTWQGLVGQQMQGTQPADDPAQSAFTDRFYTGRQQTWTTEQIDLTPYAGQTIQLRFEYVTDLVLTWGGFALDNIAIPEIGFYDNAETALSGWTAEGFTRATGYLPQPWHLLLITYNKEVPAVTSLPLPGNQRITHTIEPNNDGKRPILIVAASAPLTLEPAHYRLEVTAVQANGEQ